MGVGPRLAGAELALLSWPGATSGAPNLNCWCPNNFHEFIIWLCAPGKMVNFNQVPRYGV